MEFQEYGLGPRLSTPANPTPLGPKATLTPPYHDIACLFALVLVEYV